MLYDRDLLEKLDRFTASPYEIVAYRVVMPRRTYTQVHTHPGPEAWYILSGEQCLETPAGVMRARAGQSMTAPPTVPMRLTNRGSSVRRAFFIVIHDPGQPWIAPADEGSPQARAIGRRRCLPESV